MCTWIISVTNIEIKYEIFVTKNERKWKKFYYVTQVLLKVYRNVRVKQTHTHTLTKNDKILFWDIFFVYVRFLRLDLFFCLSISLILCIWLIMGCSIRFGVCLFIYLRISFICSNKGSSSMKTNTSYDHL